MSISRYVYASQQAVSQQNSGMKNNRYLDKKKCLAVARLLGWFLLAGMPVGQSHLSVRQ